MSEPQRALLRPITMTRSLTVALVALLVLAGCGSATDSSNGSAAAGNESSSPSATPTGTPTLQPGQPPVTSTFDISVPGLPSPLRVTRQEHPRGGFQLRIFAPQDGTWAEVEVDGHPLVPFLALDVQEQPLSVDCADGAVVITRAVAHRPAGVSSTWDIKQTTYAVKGSRATAGETRDVADNVPPKQLEARYPSLVRHEAFRTCRS